MLHFSPETHLPFHPSHGFSYFRQPSELFPFSSGTCVLSVFFIKKHPFRNRPQPPLYVSSHQNTSRLPDNFFPDRMPCSYTIILFIFVVYNHSTFYFRHTKTPGSNACKECSTTPNHHTENTKKLQLMTFRISKPESRRGRRYAWTAGI